MNRDIYWRYSFMIFMSLAWNPQGALMPPSLVALSSRHRTALEGLLLEGSPQLHPFHWSHFPFSCWLESGGRKNESRWPMQLNRNGALKIVLGLENPFSGPWHASFSASVWSKEDAALNPTECSFFCSILMCYLGGVVPRHLSFFKKLKTSVGTKYD